MNRSRRRTTTRLARAATTATAVAAAAAALACAGLAHAQDVAAPGRTETLLVGILDTIVYSTVGIVMTAIGFKVVDWLTPGNLAEEIAHKENRALAILAGAIMLGICIIIAGVISA